MAHLTPGTVFARRVREARKRRGWTQQDLADAVEQSTGGKFDRTVIVKIESGATRPSARSENVALQQVFAIAAALDVAPVHLLVPLENEETVAITPRHIVRASTARGWIRGRRPLNAGARALLAFLGELPDDELHERLTNAPGSVDPEVAEILQGIGRLVKEGPPDRLDRLDRLAALFDSLETSDHSEEENDG